ncbi:hypothetical protein H0H92_007285 [Tricholoma furcatifolium]|nr:hypothetical protein H0H92_007285 [Tricholoma furcatifolium]
MFTLLSSGSNAHGQLANGTSEDSHEFQPCIFSGCASNNIPADIYRVLDIASGANHTVLLLEMDTHSGSYETQLWGSGDGRVGQLGVEHSELMEDSTSFRPIKLPLQQAGLSEYRPKFIAASWETTYIAFSQEGHDDVLISMGSNDFGDLGVGKIGKLQRAASFHVVSFECLSIERGLPSNTTITILSLAAGQHHVVAQLEFRHPDESRSERCVVGWGTSRHGQLGNIFDEKGRPVPFISIPRILPVKDDNDPVIKIALGHQHTVLLHASGNISSLGSNRKGQLEGLGDARHVTQLDCTWNGTYAVADGDNGVQRILATGSSAHGQLGRQIVSDVLPSFSPVQLSLSNVIVSRIACGTEHALALLSRRSEMGFSLEAWGWGWNEHGNLGIGTTENAFIPIRLWPPVEVNENQRIIGVWGGSGTSWIAIVTKDSSL